MQPTFVVLTDLSSAADTALAFTTRLAKQVDGRLVLLHVYQDPLLYPEADVMPVAVIQNNQKEVVAELEQRTKQLAVPAEVELSLDTLGLAVAGVVQRRHPLLLAIGREEPEDLFDRLIIHTALPILHDARYPLLLVPHGWQDAAPPTRIAVAADGRAFDLTYPSLALAGLLTSLHATTTVVHVAAAHGPSQGAVGLESVQRTGLFGPLTGNSLYEVREEATSDGIMHAARELGAELLVVLARPHTFVGGLFHRSVTARLLRHSTIPVLVLPTTA